jgi:hypothetical protein
MFQCADVDMPVHLCGVVCDDEHHCVSNALSLELVANIRNRMH